MRLPTFTIVLAACASTPPSIPTGGPRGLTASEHLALARQHDEQARAHPNWPEPTSVPGGPDVRDQPMAMPWFRTWDTSADHERLAAIHRSKAAELEAAYQEACGARSAEEVSISPLVRYGVGGWPTASGAIIYLTLEAGTPDQLLAAMRCHRAYMMLAPTDMAECPLDLPGLVLDARGDPTGITVSLTVRDPALIPELQRRAAHDLEVGQHHMSVHETAKP